ncbi:hypothetical protein EDD18DRAFT_289860 [Armillaria luteobubalina]|uniref:Uncharacterized protein n=1 Tax=Armillaria luteobubalina TaxID=153913 RepID=A0AA39TML6_9AGAR|nr:hypothetical protein EDD18DRAFT_289860 [Armillaria luteobubalina]
MWRTTLPPVLSVISILCFLLIMDPRSFSSFKPAAPHFIVNSRTEASLKGDLWACAIVPLVIQPTHFGSILRLWLLQMEVLWCQSDIAVDFPSSDPYEALLVIFLSLLWAPDPMPRGLSPERTSLSWAPIPAKQRLALPPAP